jgi:hypothetical protein
MPISEGTICAAHNLLIAAANKRATFMEGLVGKGEEAWLMARAYRAMAAELPPFLQSLRNGISIGVTNLGNSRGSSYNGLHLDCLQPYFEGAMGDFPAAVAANYMKDPRVNRATFALIPITTTTYAPAQAGRPTRQRDASAADEGTPPTKQGRSLMMPLPDLGPPTSQGIIGGYASKSTNLSCFACRAPGHLASECPSRYAAMLGEACPGFTWDGSRDPRCWRGDDITPATWALWPGYLLKNGLPPISAGDSAAANRRVLPRVPQFGGGAGRGRPAPPGR